jgi:hypothetical protein
LGLNYSNQGPPLAAKNFKVECHRIISGKYHRCELYNRSIIGSLAAIVQGPHDLNLLAPVYRSHAYLLLTHGS